VESDLSGRRGVTIVARLVLMGVAGLVSVGIVAAFAVWSSSRQAAANRDMAQVSDGMSQLVQYTRAATSLAGVAATEHAAAAVDLPAYLVLYHRLETELSDQDDAMMAAVQAAGDLGTRTSHTSNWIILLAGLLAPVSKGGPR
jgi:hypothetical protein